MKNYRWLNWTLVAAVTGCAGPAGPNPLQMSQHPQQTQLAQMPTREAPPQPGFTQRFTSAIMPGQPHAAPMANQQLAAKVAHQRTDPIALSNAAGAPTAELCLSMAQLADRGGNTHHARNMYQRALATDAGNVEAMLGLGRLEDREGNLDAAIRIYQQAAAAQPQNAKVLNDLALCHARNGQLPASYHLLQQAIRLQPAKKLYRNNIAKVLIELNRIDEAVGNLAAVHPPAIAQYNVGVLLHERSRSSEAVPFLTAATQIDPSLQQARVLLAEITGESTDATRFVQAAPVANDHVLPTPMTPPGVAGGASPALPYPSTGVPAAMPATQPVPAETAWLPVHQSPVLLPPVR